MVDIKYFILYTLFVICILNNVRNGVVMNFENLIYLSFNGILNKSIDSNGDLDGFLINVKEEPELGFNFGYLLFIPLKIRPEPTLIIEGPAVGEAGPLDKACKLVYDKAKFELEDKGYPHWLAKKLECPLIMPLFPRPEDKENNTNIFTHALTSRSMSVKNSVIERIDLQLINMFRQIKKSFAKADIIISDKFILKGFSAGGEFAHRFSILHPQYVLAAVSGGAMHSFTLPLKSYKNELLLWPNGIGNADEYSDFKFEDYYKIKQLNYLGDKDFNDSVPYSDSYTEEERQQVFRLFGTAGNPDRWNYYQKFVVELGLDNITCITDQGMDHRPSEKIRDTIYDFLADVIES